MKKLVSILIVLGLIVSLCTVSAFAQDTVKFDCYERFVAEFGEPVYYDELFVSFENNEPSYYVVVAQMYEVALDPLPDDSYVGIVSGGLVFRQPSVHKPFVIRYGIYDVADDKFYDITKVDIKAYDGLYEYLIESNKATMIGDVDYDDKITVLDATIIQRMLANLQRVFSTKIADYNCDGYVDIMDATTVQLNAAKLEVPTVNEDLVYVPYNDDFNIYEGIRDLNYVCGYNAGLEFGDHNMDSNDFGAIIKSKEQFLSVFNFDIEKYDEEFFETKALIATVMIVTDYSMTNTICYAGVYKDTLVLINQESTSGSGDTALPIAPPYLSIIEINKSDVEYVEDILWIPN